MIRNLSVLTKPPVKEIQRRIKVEPYKRVIGKLKEIKDYQNPIKKAKVIG
jgi:hypothetical protein